MLLWFTDLMNVTEEVTIHRPNVLTLLSSAFIRGDLNAVTRGPFIFWGFPAWQGDEGGPFTSQLSTLVLVLPRGWSVTKSWAAKPEQFQC